jgi:maltose alpha-D-glucosyltransferase/alpha-amylase
VLDRAAEITARIEAHRGAQAAGEKTRIHGDYHLGQVLVAENDFVVIDFEGEPRKTLAERRAKQSALRDVAGMLLSFDYAMHEALALAAAQGIEAREETYAAARAWRDAAQSAFLAGYSQVRPISAAPGLLELFVLEKALYELGYELANRPDWSRIPLRGLLDILQRPTGGGTP